jgi:MFS family permease
LILSAFVIPLILFEIPAGILADRYGRRLLLYLGLLIAGVMTWIFSIADNPFLMLLSAFLAASGIALSWPSLEGILTVVSPIHRRGETLGVWGFSRDMGYVLGPLLGGFLASRTSISTTFKALSLILLFVAAVGLIKEGSVGRKRIG